MFPIDGIHLIGFKRIDLVSDCHPIIVDKLPKLGIEYGSFRLEIGGIGKSPTIGAINTSEDFFGCET
jgi:hypothetical protein